MFRILFRYLSAGLAALLPLAVTVGLLAWLWHFLQNYIGPKTFLGERLVRLSTSQNEMVAYSVGWLIVLCILFLFGFLLEIGFYHLWKKCEDRIRKIPLAGYLLGTARQVTDVFMGKDAMQGMSPVYCRFGREPGTLMLALLPLADAFLVNGRRYKVVIVPTAPIPFGGAMLLVPEEDVFNAEMSIDDLLKFYVSMGMTAPDVLEKGTTPSPNPDQIY